MSKPINRYLIREAWQSYRREVMPAAAGPVQVEETRRGFYAGAASLFGAITSVLDPDAEPTPRDLLQMEAISHELEQYLADLKPGGPVA